MRNTLKILLAIACALLAVAVALLIYLEFGKPESADEPQDQTEPSASYSADTSAPEGTSVPEETTVPAESTAPTETEFVPETQEGGMPVYPFDDEEENEPADVPSHSGTDATEGSFVPDEDELPKMPL